MTSRTNCCVYGFLNKRKNSKLSFFVLPTDCERRNKWLELIGRMDLLEKGDKLKSSSYQVCSQHFEDSMMAQVHMKKLLPHALPTKRSGTQPSPSTSKNETESNKYNVSTQTEELQEEEIENTSIKRKSRANLQEPKRKRRGLEYELDNIQKELEAKNPLSLSPPSDDDDEITKRY